MLIFDSFPNKEKAQAFGEEMKRRFNLNFTVHDSQEESNKIDIFPFQLHPPIVLVERDEPNVEEEVERFVKHFDGTFAGT